MGAAMKRGKAEYDAFRARAEAYLDACEAAGKSVSIGGFCLAMDLSLDTLKLWTERRRQTGRGSRGRNDPAAQVIDRFWTRYFACAEAALDGKDTFNAAKFKLERLIAFFEGGKKEGEETAAKRFSVSFDKEVEPYSQ